MRSFWKAGVAYSWRIVVTDSSGARVTGLVNANFTKRLTKNDANDATAVTVTEVDSSNHPGHYKVTATYGSNGFWVADVSHATYGIWTDAVQTYTRGDLDDFLYSSTGNQAISIGGSGDVRGNVYFWVNQDVNLLDGNPDGLGGDGNVPVSVRAWRDQQPNVLLGGRVDSRVGAIVNGAIVNGTFADDAISASKVASDQDAAAAAAVRTNLAAELARIDALEARLTAARALLLDNLAFVTAAPPTVAAIVAGVLAGVVDGTITLKQALALIQSVSVNNNTGEPSGTASFKDPTGAIERVSATYDAHGNRTVTLSPPA